MNVKNVLNIENDHEFNEVIKLKVKPITSEYLLILSKE